MLLDSFFDNVCELDLVFNFYKVSDPVSSTRKQSQPSPRYMPSLTKYFSPER